MVPNNQSAINYPKIRQKVSEVWNLLFCWLPLDKKGIFGKLIKLAFFESFFVSLLAFQEWTIDLEKKYF